MDIHTHLGQQWGQRPALTADMLLRWMDMHNVAEAVVLPLINPEAWDHPLTTDYVLKETAAHRDRLVPFCSIDPRTVDLDKRDLLARYRDAGARGFGEHKAGVAMDDAHNIELFRACAEVGLPILFHLDNVRNTDAPGLPGLVRVLREVPDAVFIGHAPGFWSNISGDVTAEELGGYPKRGVAPGGALDRLFEAYPNLYGDLSAGSGANAIARDREFGRAFMIRNADRLLFGTDYLAPEQEVPQFELFEALELPEEVRAKIYRGNARRLLGLTKVARASSP
ncbi:MAG: amidohydrolase family protein [Candidatus Hydrogenedentales bacterium]